MTEALKLAVVGHTNVGKTSLLRTLTRDAGFGEVSHRPSTTRHVEGARLSVDGEPLLELESALFRHSYVEDETRRHGPPWAIEEFTRGGVGLDGKSYRLHQLLEERSNGRVVINDVNNAGLIVHSGYPLTSRCKYGINVPLPRNRVKQKGASAQ